MSVCAVIISQDIGDVEAYHTLGLTYADICNPSYLNTDPELCRAGLALVTEGGGVLAHSRSFARLRIKRLSQNEWE